MPHFIHSFSLQQQQQEQQQIFYNNNVWFILEINQASFIKGSDSSSLPLCMWIFCSPDLVVWQLPFLAEQRHPIIKKLAEICFFVSIQNTLRLLIEKHPRESICPGVRTCKTYHRLSTLLLRSRRDFEFFRTNKLVFNAASHAYGYYTFDAALGFNSFFFLLKINKDHIKKELDALLFFLKICVNFLLRKVP